MCRACGTNRPDVHREMAEQVPPGTGGCLRVIAVPAMGVSLLALRWWRR
jgi:hypothetical protein